jgi:alpha-tubulin suppressor-like RCC1 family protein
MTKNRKGSAYTSSGMRGGTQSTVTKSDINSRDHAGLTILHRAASSSSENAATFATALIEHPSIDLYLQDLENGWTALHRALYFGNVGIARALLARDLMDASGHGGSSTVLRAGSLIKVKDFEGNSPFDVYNATIARRTLDHKTGAEGAGIESDNESAHEDDLHPEKLVAKDTSIDGDELFAFGSNKNLTLGFGDEDDRQYPEKITLKRPLSLIHRFHREFLAHRSTDLDLSDALTDSVSDVSDIPALVRNKPIVIQDVAMSKLSSAILTTDPESNLYVCGFGPGGRLGTGDEVTRFSYVCLEVGALAGKHIARVALGQNHTLAVTSEGELFAWGTNTYGQLGYSLPRPVKDEEPMQNTPRQIFGPLKKEMIVGVAASAVHSVAHTSTSLFTWGKNTGQLGLMDSDSRSLEAQTVPRRVGASLFSSSIEQVSATDRATVCLLSNHSVFVFTHYGHVNVKFPLGETFSNFFLKDTTVTRYEAEPNHISMVTSGGDTIAAVSSRGDLFTVIIAPENNSGSASTTNPSKIRSALSQPQKIWSLRKGNWDGIRSVDVSENGSVIICTKAGAVWRRVKRVKIKDAHSKSDYKPKDYKFQRIAGLTNVAAVRSNIFGAYAAIRKDSDITKTQIAVDGQTIWDDVAPLLCLHDLEPSEAEEDNDSETPRFWTPALPKDHVDPLKRAVLLSPDLEADVERHINGPLVDLDDYDVDLCSTLSDLCIPVHGFMLAGRSSVLRQALSNYRDAGQYESMELLRISGDGDRIKLTFVGLDFITLVNLAIDIYTDTVVDVWHFTRHAPNQAFRYRQVRPEMMKIASKLNMSKLEASVRLMNEPQPRLNIDFDLAIRDPEFFEDGDTILELDGDEVMVHSSFLCRRCPFFEGLFNGRAGGQWLAGRRMDETEAVRIDLKHIDPSTFHLVLRYLYADVGTELFDDVVATDLDEFSEVVMDVMSVANELMLDRLSQICQQMLGRFGRFLYFKS